VHNANCLLVQTRKGTVGARLPYEPWNMDLSELNPRTPRSPSTTSGATTRKPEVGSVSDFTLNLGGDAPDFASTLSVDEEDDSGLYGSSLHEYTDGDSPPSLSYTPSNPSLHSLSRSSSLASVSSSGLRSIDSMNSFSSGSVSDISEPTNDCDTERFQDQDPLQSEPDFDYYWEPSPDLTLDPLESKSQPRSRSPSTWVDMGRTPHQSLYDNTSLHALDDTSFKPGTSASTIRSSLHNAMGSARFGSSLLSEKRSFEEEVVDGSEWEGRRGNGHHGDQDRKRGDNGGGGGGGREGTYNGNNFGAGGGGGGRDRDGDDRRDRRRNIATSFSTPSESDDDQEEETDASTDDYGVDSASSSALTSALHHPVDSISDSPSGTSTGTDDDVPLAQRIPTALTAQKTIRKQVRDERDRRRKERAADRSGSAARQRQTISPTGTSASGTSMALFGAVSSSQEVALHSSRSMGRLRTKTMPSNTNSPFAIDDLTKKLLTVQAAGSPPAALLQTRLPPDRELSANNDELARRLLSFQAAGSPAAVTTALRPSSSQGRDQHKATAMSQPPFTQSRPSADNGSRGTGLRAMRSLHGLASKAAEGYSVATTEASSDQRLGRSVTTGRSRRVDDVFLNVKSGSMPPSSFDGRVSTDKLRPHRTSEDTAQQSAGGYALASADYESSAPLKSGSRPRIPPLPAAEVLSNIVQSSGSKIQLASQRIFIENKQRFNMVEIGPLTNAGEVVHMVASQAALEKLGAGSGGWMLWEVAQDFGMGKCTFLPDFW
jgi:hypothetical protein